IEIDSWQEADVTGQTGSVRLRPWGYRGRWCWPRWAGLRRGHPPLLLLAQALRLTPCLFLAACLFELLSPTEVILSDLFLLSLFPLHPLAGLSFASLLLGSAGVLLPPDLFLPLPQFPRTPLGVLALPFFPLPLLAVTLLSFPLFFLSLLPVPRPFD